MKLKTQILAIALGLAASTSLVWSADRPPRATNPDNPRRVAGNQNGGQLR